MDGIIFGFIDNAVLIAGAVTGYEIERFLYTDQMVAWSPPTGSSARTGRLRWSSGTSSPQANSRNAGASPRRHHRVAAVV
jgi:hypothetical protein